MRPGAVITLVDGVNGERQLDDCPESVKQAAVADCLLVSKTDLAAAHGGRAAAQAPRAHESRRAGPSRSSRGEIAPDALFGAALDDPRREGRADRALAQ